VKALFLRRKTPHKDSRNNIEKLPLYYSQTLRVGKHHTINPSTEGILSCSLASSRGKPPNGIHAPNTILLLELSLYSLNPFI
jgi:hypothetical protein